MAPNWGFLQKVCPSVHGLKCPKMFRKNGQDNLGTAFLIKPGQFMLVA